MAERESAGTASHIASSNGNFRCPPLAVSPEMMEGDSAKGIKRQPKLGNKLGKVLTPGNFPGIGFRVIGRLFMAHMPIENGDALAPIDQGFALYEFYAYHNGAVALVDRADVTSHSYNSRGAAKAYAGRLAKRVNGPVDIALVGSAEWNERYICTANPSEYHASGYSIERLDS